MGEITKRFNAPTCAKVITEDLGFSARAKGTPYLLQTPAP